MIIKQTGLRVNCKYHTCEFSIAFSPNAYTAPIRSRT